MNESRGIHRGAPSKSGALTKDFWTSNAPYFAGRGKNKYAITSIQKNGRKRMELTTSFLRMGNWTAGKWVVRHNSRQQVRGKKRTLTKITQRPSTTLSTGKALHRERYLGKAVRIVSMSGLSLTLYLLPWCRGTYFSLSLRQWRRPCASIQ